MGDDGNVIIAGNGDVGDDDGSIVIVDAIEGDDEGDDAEGDDEGDEQPLTVLDEYSLQLPDTIARLNYNSPLYFGSSSDNNDTNTMASILKSLQTKMIPGTTVAAADTVTDSLSSSFSKVSIAGEAKYPVSTSTTVPVPATTTAAKSSSSSQSMCIVCKKNQTTLKCEWCSKLLWCPLCKVVGKRAHEETCDSF